MKRKRAGAVRLSDHAYERWKLRVAASVKRTSVAARIRRRIAAELKLGAEVSRNGALEIEVRPGVWAICYPSFMGGWVVATIIREGWEDMEERARYGEKNSEKIKTTSLCGEVRSVMRDGWFSMVVELESGKVFVDLPIDALSGVQEGGLVRVRAEKITNIEGAGSL